MIDPWPSLGDWLLPALIIAGFMIVANLYLVLKLLPRNEGVPHLGTVIWVVGLFVMSVSLWGALIYAVLNPGPAALAGVFLAGNSMMGVFGLWAIGLLYRAEEKRLPRDGWRWPTLFTLLVLGSELLMGTTFVLGAEGPAPFASLGYPGLVTLTAASIGSVWFLGAMTATMVVVVLWLPIGTAERRALLAFSAAPLGIPLALAAPVAGGVAMGVVMALVLVVLLRELLRRSAPTPAFVRLGLLLSVALGAMAVGVLGYVASPDSAVGAASFATPTIAVMATELWVLFRWGFRAAPAMAVPESASTGRPTPSADL